MKRAREADHLGGDQVLKKSRHQTDENKEEIKTEIKQDKKVCLPGISTVPCKLESICPNSMVRKIFSEITTARTLIGYEVSKLLQGYVLDVLEEQGTSAPMLAMDALVDRGWQHLSYINKKETDFVATKKRTMVET